MDRPIYFGKLSRYTNPSKFMDLEDIRERKRIAEEHDLKMREKLQIINNKVRNCGAIIRESL